MMVRQSRAFREGTAELGEFFTPERKADLLARREAARHDVRDPYAGKRLGVVNMEPPTKKASSPEVMSNGTLRAILEYGAVSDPDLRQMAAMAVTRHTADPHGSVTEQDLRQFSFQAESAGNKSAAASINNLLKLAESGELRRMMAGEKTRTVRVQLANKLHKYGATKFALMDTVMTSDGQYGQIIDYNPDSKTWLVALDHFTVVEKKSGDLTKTAKQRVSGEDQKKQHALQALREIRVDAQAGGDSVTNLLKTTNFGGKALRVAREAIAGINFGFPPESRFIGFAAVQYNADNTIRDATAKVAFRFPTHLGSRPEIIVPVHVKSGKVVRPDTFKHAGRLFPLTQEAVDNVLQRFGVADRPRHYRPNRIPAMIRMPDTQVRGMFGPARQLPFDFPGNPPDGSRI